MADMAAEIAAVIVLNAAGVHQHERLLLAARLGVMAVAGHAGRGVNNRVPAAGDAVEEGGFAHVRAANQGDKGAGGG